MRGFRVGIYSGLLKNLDSFLAPVRAGKVKRLASGQTTVFTVTPNAVVDFVGIKQRVCDPLVDCTGAVVAASFEDVAHYRHMGTLRHG